MSGGRGSVGGLLADLLEAPALRDISIPFSLPPIAVEDWTPGPLEKSGDSTWTFLARSGQGVEVEWSFRHFPDTRAIECWGVARHRGESVVRGVREIAPWDVRLTYSREERLPWSRSFNGSFWLSAVFPPPDFAPVDRRLVESVQVYPFMPPISVRPMGDGRSSYESLPCHLVVNGPRTTGLGCFLEWSGHWDIQLCPEAIPCGASRESYAVTWRALVSDLSLDLHPGETLPLPRFLVTAFSGDFEAGGRSIRRHIRRHVTPKLGGVEFLPPTSFNHWFAFENTFTADALIPCVQGSAEAGLDYFCVDGGWFTGGFREGIGNWTEGDAAKFPDGIKPFSDFVTKHGLKYGTWFEPEFAHENSTLYREHPDWFWPTPEEEIFRRPGEQVSSTIHLLDFGRREVQLWWAERIRRAYEEWNVRWIRWDCNQALRPNWTAGVPSGRHGRRQLDHIQGLYATWSTIREQCPDLVIEQCASGGLRIDLGTVRHGHTFWMNDQTTNSDMVRLFQMNLNRILPGNYPNTNLCQNRRDYSEYDFFSHACGPFGFSGDFHHMPRKSFEALRDFVAGFKRTRHLLLEDFSWCSAQPTAPDSPCSVRFSSGSEDLRYSFNNRPGSATRSFTPA